MFFADDDGDGIGSYGTDMEEMWVGEDPVRVLTDETGNNHNHRPDGAFSYPQSVRPPEETATAPSLAEMLNTVAKHGNTFWNTGPGSADNGLFSGPVVRILLAAELKYPVLSMTHLQEHAMLMMPNYPQAPLSQEPFEQIIALCHFV